MTVTGPASLPKPLAQPGPWNAVASGYDEVSRKFMEEFSIEGIRLLTDGRGLNPSCRLLDVACGPGTTSLLYADQVGSIDAVDFSDEMLSIFAGHLLTKNFGNITLHHCDGQELPFNAGSFDYALSMFGLMFFPDRVRGMLEMFRVLAPGGKVLIASWAPLARSSALTALFEAVRAIDPTRPAATADVTSLENPEVFRSELTIAGFSNIEIHEVERHMEFDSSDEFWDTMAKGAVPLVMMRKQLGETAFEQKSALAKEHLRGLIGDRRKLSSIAFLAVAEKA